LKSSVCSNYRREESSHARNRVASEIKGLVSRFHQYSHASELLTMQTERQKRHYNRVMCNLYSNGDIRPHVYSSTPAVATCQRLMTVGVSLPLLQSTCSDF